MKKLIILFLIISNGFAIEFTNENELIEYAVNNSKILNIEKLYASEAVKSSKMNIKDFLPAINLNWYEFDKSTDFNTSRTKVITLSIRQKLTDGGKRLLSYSMNKANSRFTVLENNQEENSFIIEVLSTFYSYLLIDSEIKIQEEILKQNSLLEQIADTKFREGLGIKTDLYEIKINNQEYKKELKNLNNQKEDLYKKLKIICSVPDDEEIVFNFNYDLLLSKDNSVWSDENLKQKLIDNDLEFQKLKTKNLFLKKQYEYSKRVYIPNISVEGEISFSGTHYPLTQPEYSLKFIIDFDSLPFTNINWNNGWGFNKSRLQDLTNSYSQNINGNLTYFSDFKKQKLMLDKSIEEENRYLKELEVQIDSFIEKYQNLNEDISILTETITMLENKITITNLRYEQGLSTVSDCLNDQVKLLKLKKELSQCQIEIILLTKKIEFLSKQEKTCVKSF
ncbi:MAG: TolC family protein [Treponema sp.]|nr:TolC family protein [Treponema sp.]